MGLCQSKCTIIASKGTKLTGKKTGACSIRSILCTRNRGIKLRNGIGIPNYQSGAGVDNSGRAGHSSVSVRIDRVQIDLPKALRSVNVVYMTPI